MEKSLYAEINKALDNRKTWADRQQLAYTMRNGGVRRSGKPYSGAPDGWYPLGDSSIDKLKPSYISQMYGAETIASFVAKCAQDEDLTSAAAYWLDYQLKQRSNFQRTMLVAIDQTLEQAFTPVKVFYDSNEKCLAFEQIDPLHLIVPDSCQEYNENGGTDWMVHIIHLTVAEYEANDQFDQSDSFIKSIKGKGGDNTYDEKSEEIKRREGLNCSAFDNQIVLWEVYIKDRESKKITVETISPLLPCSKNTVRESFVLPYNKGIFKNGQTFPIFKFRYEIKGKGHYSGRGVVEIAAPFEMSLTKSWNSIHEHMDFSSRPNYEQSGATILPNANDMKTGPGQILPPGLKLAQHPPVPTSLRADMDLTAAVAEDRLQIPNLSGQEHLTGKGSTSGDVTATQINAIVGQSQQGTDMRARIFQLDLAEGLKMAYAIALQYLTGKDSFQYVVDREVRTIDQQALHEEYEITPNGGADNWNKGALVQKRMSYFQVLRGNEYIDQGELVKWLLEGDDPRMVRRLYRDPAQMTGTQMEEQAVECLLIEAGFPAQVEPANNDKVHAAGLAEWAQDRIARVKMTPEMAKRTLDHFAGHGAQMKAKKDPALKQFEQQLMPLIEQLVFISQQAGPPVPNVVPMGQPTLPDSGATDGTQSSMQAVPAPTPAAL